MRKFLVGLVAAAALLVAPATSRAYVHVDAAQNYCQQWNNQSAYDNMRNTEASLGRPPYLLVIYYYPSNRFSSNELDVAMRWEEWKDGNRLGIYYVCRVVGTDDQHMTITAISGSSVFWSRP